MKNAIRNLLAAITVVIMSINSCKDTRPPTNLVSQSEQAHELNHISENPFKKIVRYI